jgi:hypothetical protein
MVKVPSSNSESFRRYTDWALAVGSKCGLVG